MELQWLKLDRYTSSLITKGAQIIS